jgi:desulfoferrodoxin
MTQYGDFYHCELCGHVVTVVYPGTPTLVCCGQPMKLLKVNTTDASKEKHVPVTLNKGDGVLIKVGSAPHPMTAEHHIALIEVVLKNGIRCRAKLDPTGAPEAEFPVKAEDIEAVYEYCNIHGLWKA